MGDTVTVERTSATPSTSRDTGVAPVRERFPWFFRDVFGLDPRPWFEGWRLPTFMEDIKIEQMVKDDTLIIRAEAPGIDPATDAEVVVHEGMLRLRIERHQEEVSEGDEMKRSEFRYGSFERVLSLPKGVHPEAITASYTDGILEVRVPLPHEAAKPSGTKVPIST